MNTGSSIGKKKQLETRIKQKKTWQVPVPVLAGADRDVSGSKKRHRYKHRTNN
jgi:hypothetical protein